MNPSLLSKTAKNQIDGHSSKFKYCPILLNFSVNLLINWCLQKDKAETQLSKSNLTSFLYKRRLYYQYLLPVFRKQNNPCDFRTHTHKFTRKRCFSRFLSDI